MPVCQGASVPVCQAKYTPTSNLALGVISSLPAGDQLDNPDFHGCNAGKTINNFALAAITAAWSASQRPFDFSMWTNVMLDMINMMILDMMNPEQYDDMTTIKPIAAFQYEIRTATKWTTLSQ